MSLIFVNVILPLFLVISIGFVSQRTLKPDSASLSKLSYYVFIPAFIFDMILKIDISASVMGQMILYMSLVYILSSLMGFAIARVTGQSTGIAIGFLMVTGFGNSGNMGLTIINFKLGEEALPAGTLYYITIMIVSLLICIVGVNFYKQTDFKRSLVNVFKTPIIIAVAFAMVFLVTGIEVPGYIEKITSLLGKAMIPVLIITLGVQLGEIKKISIDRNVVLASFVRLIGGPVVAVLLAIPFSLSDISYHTGIIQASMPTALMVSIIALEHEIEPEFVITTILFSTLFSFLTLMGVLYYLN